MRRGSEPEDGGNRPRGARRRFLGYPSRVRRPPSTVRLEPRLAAVAELVPAGSVVADIGTDHALLPLALLESGRAVRCIASEPSAARLARASARVAASRWASRLDLRSGDGLAVLSRRDTVTVVVLAGLGGHTIRRILDGPRRKTLAPARLVLQPQTAPAVVRRWLAGAGYRLVAERLVREARRFYVVLAAEPGAEDLCHPSLSPGDLFEAGPLLVRSGDPLVEAFWRAELRRARAILERARGGRGRDDARARAALAGWVLAALHDVPRI